MFRFLRSSRAAAKPAPGSPEDEQVGCFGKLPIRADFIKYNVTQREVLVVDQWVQQGHALFSRRALGSDELEGDVSSPEPRVFHGVFAGSSEDRTVLVTFTPSRDRSGRRYPFVVFNVAQPYWLALRPAGIAPAYDAFFRGAGELCRQRWRNEPFATLTGCIDSLRGLSVLSNPEQMAAMELSLLQDTSVQCLLDILRPDADTRAAVLHAFIELMRLVARRTPLRVNWGIGLPLARDAASLATLVFWLRLVDGVLGNGHWRPTYFWTSSPGSAGRLVVFFRPVAAAFLVQCMEPSVRDSNVLDVESEAATLGAPSELARRLAAVEEGTLLDLFRSFGNGVRA